MHTLFDIYIYMYIKTLTISTTKRVNTCLVPSSDSWIIQAKKVDPCTSFCSKRVCTVSCSGVPFGSHKSETPDYLFFILVIAQVNNHALFPVLIWTDDQERKRIL